jgi:CubicO group peptidase (beta-lactamase class C family)
LQFGLYYLNLMPDGQAYMGGGAYLRPRDQLKLGQLYLAGGVWSGKQIVSKEWVKDSTSFHSRFAPAHSLGQEHEYGYGWHLHNLESGEKNYRVFAAEGNGGQFVIVIPDLDLVVGITGGSYGEFNKWYRWELELVPQFIIPAAGPSQRLAKDRHCTCAVERRWTTAGESPARELGSLHPEAIRAAAEETKPSEPLV